MSKCRLAFQFPDIWPFVFPSIDLPPISTLGLPSSRDANCQLCHVECTLKLPHVHLLNVKGRVPMSNDKGSTSLSNDEVQVCLSNDTGMTPLLKPLKITKSSQKVGMCILVRKVSSKAIQWYKICLNWIPMQNVIASQRWLIHFDKF